MTTPDDLVSLLEPGERLLHATMLPRLRGLEPKAYWWTQKPGEKVRLRPSPIADLPPEELVRLVEAIKEAG